MIYYLNEWGLYNYIGKWMILIVYLFYIHFTITIGIQDPKEYQEYMLSSYSYQVPLILIIKFK